MATGVTVTVEVTGLKRTQAVFERMSKKLQSRRALHERWAILAYNWIQRNFETEGGLVGGWEKLKPNTLAGRRMGTGRILQDTGRLKGSFVPEWTDEYAKVGSPLPVALYHEKGTRPYIIRPKRDGGVLRFAIAGEYGIRTTTLKSGRKVILPFAGKGGYVYTREVHHPGLPQRKLLPRPNEPELLRDLVRASEDYLMSQEGLGNVQD